MIVNLVFLFIIIFGSIISYFWFVNNFPAEQREFGFKEPVSPVMERITDFHDLLMIFNKHWTNLLLTRGTTIKTSILTLIEFWWVP